MAIQKRSKEDLSQHVKLKEVATNRLLNMCDIFVDVPFHFYPKKERRYAHHIKL